MRKVNFKITSSYKNSRKLKKYSAESFLAKYPLNDEARYRLIIDREDERRLSLQFTENEFKEFIEMVNQYKNDFINESGKIT